MIKGERKAESSTGASPAEKKPKQLTRDDKIDEMFVIMADMEKDMDQTKLIAKNANETAEMAMKSLHVVNSTIKQMQDKDSSIEADIKEIKDMLSNTSHPTWPTPAGRGGQNGAEQGLRELQVIATGLKEAIDEEDAISQVTKIVQEIGAGNKHTRVFTFTDPSKIGVVEFKSIAAKIGFLKKANTLQTEWTNGDNMHFKCNDTLAKQLVDKELGQIKSHLHTKKGYSLSDIKIKWKRQTVEVKGSPWKKVAWTEADGKIKYADEALGIKEEVKAFMQAWKEKRGIENDEL